MTVDIEVDLDVNIADGIKSIKRQLKSIEDDLDIDLDIDDLDLDIPEEKTVKVHLRQVGNIKPIEPDHKTLHITADARPARAIVEELQEKDIEKKVKLKADKNVFLGSLGPITKKINDFQEDRDFQIGIDQLHFSRSLAKLKSQIDTFEKGQEIRLDVEADLEGQSLSSLLGVQDAQDSQQTMISTLKAIKNEITNKQPRRITNSSDFGSVRKRDKGDSDKDMLKTPDVDFDMKDYDGLDLTNRFDLNSGNKTYHPTLTDGITSGGGIVDVLRSFRDKRKPTRPGQDGPTSIGKKTGTFLSRLKKVGGKVRPTFGRIYAVLSALLPVIAGLAVQVVGLAAAFGALGGAAIAVGGLGLLGGQADTLAGSVANAEEKVNSFKSDLFQIFEPVADSFSDDSQAMMDSFLENISRVTDETRGLQQFTSIIISTFPFLATALEDSLAVVNSYAPAIGRLTDSAARMIATGLPDFLDGLLKSGLSSAGQFGDIVGLLVSIAMVGLEVVDMFLNLLQVLSPLQAIFGIIAKILSSKIIQNLALVAFTIVSVISVVYALSVAFSVISGALSAVAVAFLGSGTAASLFAGTLIGSVASSISFAITQIGTLILQLYNLNAALGITAGLLAAVTGGVSLALAAGAIAGIGQGAMDTFGSINSPKAGAGVSDSLGGGRGGDTYVNVEGDMDNQSLQSIRDITKKQNEKRSSQNGMGF